jgi:hypothetical protein
LKTPITKRDGGVTQGVSPEFKPSTARKKKKKKKTKKTPQKNGRVLALQIQSPSPIQKRKKKINVMTQEIKRIPRDKMFNISSQ